MESTIDSSNAIVARLRDAIALLEAIADDGGVLEGVSPVERERLLRAVSRVYSPDRSERRRMARVTARERKAARVRAVEHARALAGIRALRTRPVVHTPNVFPPSLVELQPASPNPAFALRATAGKPEQRGSEPRTRNTTAESRPFSRLRVGPSDVECGAPNAEHRVPLQHCYVCKQHYDSIHHFYDQLCPSCAAFNFAKRTELADLSGRVALLTGGRVKIGYQAGLKLLRSGARLIVTTRFPRDAAMRYAREPDFEQWRDRLEVFGLDLRHAPSVEVFCRHLLATRARLDFIVNNACQTVRRPPDFYAHMIAAETAALSQMPRHVRELVGVVGDGGTAGDAVVARLPEVPGLTQAPQLSQLALLPEEAESQSHLFPRGHLDHDLQQVDLRGRNSWRLLLAEISTVELLEVQLVNAIAPFIINARLKPLLLRTPERDKHIVNVSAVEGQFYRSFKTTRHPHTNMAKAALNMMTRTSAADYHGDGIHMNSVDTGWITDEDPAAIAARKASEQRFHPPLDSIDGAARVVDPIIGGFNAGTHVWGQFLKDYHPTDW